VQQGQLRAGERDLGRLAGAAEVGDEDDLERVRSPAGTELGGQVTSTR